MAKNCLNGLLGPQNGFSRYFFPIRCWSIDYNSLVFFDNMDYKISLKSFTIQSHFCKKF